MGMALLMVVSVIVLLNNFAHAQTRLLQDASERLRGGWEPQNNSTEAKLGAVASESSVCSRYGTEMLQIGGNAADAVSIS
jgi:gamma-glutamyltranspeptidase/glutathione hydrolase